MTNEQQEKEPAMPATYVDPFGMPIDPAEYARLEADLAAAWEPPALLDSDLELLAADPDEE